MPDKSCRVCLNLTQNQVLVQCTHIGMQAAVFRRKAAPVQAAGTQDNRAGSVQVGRLVASIDNSGELQVTVVSLDMKLLSVRLRAIAPASIYVPYGLVLT